MAKVNFRVIRQQVERQAGARITKATEGIIDRRFKKAENELLKAIANNDISQEIAAGPYATNSKGNSFSREGNLYSFFGFENGFQPIPVLIEYIRNSISRTPPKKTRGRKHITITSTVKVANITDIEDSPASFITNDYKNKGWIYGMRHGHSGYGKYIFEKVRELKTSRTGTGLQLRGTVQGGTFFPKNEYISEELKQFRKTLNSG